MVETVFDRALRCVLTLLVLVPWLHLWIGQVIKAGIYLSLNFFTGAWELSWPGNGNLGVLVFIWLVWVPRLIKCWMLIPLFPLVLAANPEWFLSYLSSPYLSCFLTVSVSA